MKNKENDDFFIYIFFFENQLSQKGYAKVNLKYKHTLVNKKNKIQLKIHMYECEITFYIMVFIN